MTVFSCIIQYNYMYCYRFYYSLGGVIAASGQKEYKIMMLGISASLDSSEGTILQDAGPAGLTCCGRWCLGSDSEYKIYS